MNDVSQKYFGNKFWSHHSGTTIVFTKFLILGIRTVWKRQEITLTWKIFREIIILYLISRNFLLKNFESKISSLPHCVTYFLAQFSNNIFPHSVKTAPQILREIDLWQINDSKNYNTDHYAEFEYILILANFSLQKLISRKIWVTIFFALCYEIQLISLVVEH